MILPPKKLWIPSYLFGSGPEGSIRVKNEHLISEKRILTEKLILREASALLGRYIFFSVLQKTAPVSEQNDCHHEVFLFCL